MIYYYTLDTRAAGKYGGVVRPRDIAHYALKNLKLNTSLRLGIL